MLPVITNNIVQEKISAYLEAELSALIKHPNQVHWQDNHNQLANFLIDALDTNGKMQNDLRQDPNLVFNKIDNDEIVNGLRNWFKINLYLLELATENLENDQRKRNIYLAGVIAFAAVIGGYCFLNRQAPNPFMLNIANITALPLACSFIYLTSKNRDGGRALKILKTLAASENPANAPVAKGLAL